MNDTQKAVVPELATSYIFGCKSDPVVSGSLQPNLISPALRFVFQAKIIGFYVSKLHQSLLYGWAWLG